MQKLAFAVVRARIQIQDLMRSQPNDVRARLPFELNDDRDIETWLRWKLGRKALTGKESVRYLVQFLVWQARKLQRRKTLPVRHRNSNGESPDEDPFFSTIASDKRRPSSSAIEERELAQEVCECALIASNELLRQRSYGSASRPAKAVLNCLIRLTFIICSTLGREAALVFFEHLQSSDGFLQLDKSRISLTLARAILMQNPIRNVRQALRGSGFPTASGIWWTEFRSRLHDVWFGRASQRGERDG